MKEFEVKLVAKNEGLEYIEGDLVLHFNVLLKKKVWEVSLSPTRGSSYEPYEFSEEELRRIKPRIKEYLSSIKWFGLFRFKYAVNFT